MNTSFGDESCCVRELFFRIRLMFRLPQGVRCSWQYALVISPSRMSCKQIQKALDLYDCLQCAHEERQTGARQQSTRDRRARDNRRRDRRARDNSQKERQTGARQQSKRETEERQGKFPRNWETGKLGNWELSIFKKDISEKDPSLQKKQNALKLPP